MLLDSNKDNSFITSHLAVIKAQNGRRVYLPYLERLQLLKTQLEKHKFPNNLGFKI
jgi:hypothetical protein